jgi:23S rRNA (adenine2503-C2)-methyltransferase
LANTTANQAFQPSNLERALAFQKRIITGDLRCMIRVSKGADINAGCGQLKSRHLSHGISPSAT